MDYPPAPVTLKLDMPALDAAGIKALKAAVATVGHCLDTWRGFVGAVVSRPITVRVRFAHFGDLTEDDDGMSIVLAESLIGSPELPHALLLATLEAVDMAGRRWPHGKPRRLSRAKGPAKPYGYATDRALEDLSPGDMLLLAPPDGDNGDAIDDYLEQRLAQEGIAEPANTAAANGIIAWVLAPLDG
jgi:hypothetical protein